ncbi:hypothetical protein ACFQX6_50035 [Streptosporangium lutulentum]
MGVRDLVYRLYERRLEAKLSRQKETAPGTSASSSTVTGAGRVRWASTM